MKKINILKKCHSFYAFDIGEVPTKEELFIYLSVFERDDINFQKVLSNLDIDSFVYVQMYLERQDIIYYLFHHREQISEINKIFEYKEEIWKELESKISNSYFQEMKLRSHLDYISNQKEYEAVDNIEEFVSKNYFYISNSSQEIIYDIMINAENKLFTKLKQGSFIKLLSEVQQISFIKDTFEMYNIKTRQKIKLLQVMEHIESPFVLDYCATKFRNDKDYLIKLSKNKNLSSHKAVQILLDACNNGPDSLKEIKSNLLVNISNKTMSKPLFDLMLEAYGDMQVMNSYPFFKDYSFSLEHKLPFVYDKKRILFIEPEQYDNKNFLRSIREPKLIDLILKEKILDIQLIEPKFKDALEMFNNLYHNYVPKFIESLSKEHRGDFITFHLCNDSVISQKYKEEIISYLKVQKMYNIFLDKYDIIKILNKEDTDSNKIGVLRHCNLSMDILFSFDFDNLINDSHSNELFKNYKIIKNLNENNIGLDNVTEEFFYKFFDYIQIDINKLKYIKDNFDLESLNQFIYKQKDSINKTEIENHIFLKNIIEVDFEF